MRTLDGQFYDNLILKITLKRMVENTFKDETQNKNLSDDEKTGK